MWWTVTPSAEHIERNRQALAELTRLSRELRMERAWERRADEEFWRQGREARQKAEAQARARAEAARARVHAEAQAEWARIEARAAEGRRAIQRAWDEWWAAPDWEKEPAAVKFWDVVEVNKRAVLLPLMDPEPAQALRRLWAA